MCGGGGGGAFQGGQGLERLEGGAWPLSDLGVVMVFTAFREQLLGPLGKAGGWVWPLELRRWGSGHLYALRVYKVYTGRVCLVELA